MKLSAKAQNMSASVTLATAAKARQLKQAGHDVLNLTLGQPDFPTPLTIQSEAIRAISSGEASYYTASDGILPLKQAIQKRTKLDYGLDYDLSEIVVTNGVKFGLFALFQVLLDEGDEVLIPVPYWVSYAEQIKLAGGRPVFVEPSDEVKMKITVEELEKARTDKTKIIVLNSPSNPTGMIYSAEELRKIGEWAVLHQIIILADDIYAKLVYNQHEFTSIATLSDDIRKQTIILNGVSKSYAMTGWRIGYLLGNQSVIKAVTKLISQSVSNSAAVSQYAAVEALTGDQSAVEQMRLAFEARLNKFHPKVAALTGFEIAKPEGAFYLYPNIKECLTLCGYQSVTQWVNDLLEEEKVAVVTGEGFGSAHHIRISYASDDETLERAIQRIQAFIARKMNDTQQA